LAQKADELRRSPGEPTLVEFSLPEQTSIRRACYGVGLSGPARLYACLREKASELRQVPGEPSLLEFSIAEQTSLRRACYGAGLSGPARLYTCLGQKADELRTVRRRLGLSSPSMSREIPETRSLAKPAQSVAVAPAPT